jgi:PAS domain S-box-containing protein
MLPPFRPLSSSLDLQSAFAQLSRRGFSGNRLDETLCQLTATTGQILNIERVSLWGLSAERENLECIDLYELSRNRHSRGATLQAARYPEYFRALETGEPIVADDAMKHPSTQEFTNDHLLMNGISALINSPIHADGELQGVLCIERVGPHSPLDFRTATVLACGRQSGQRRPATAPVAFEGSRTARREQPCDVHCSTARVEAILISDAGTGHILDANPQAERLFGRRLEELLGILQSELYASRDALEVRDLCKSLAKTEGSEAVCKEVLACDGKLIPVEITGQVIHLEKGKKIVQGVFRPLDGEVSESTNA